MIPAPENPWAPNLVAGAVQLRRMLLGRLASSALGVAARLRLPDLLADGPRTVDDLAGIAGAAPGPLYQLMRALVAFGVFTEHASGGATLSMFALTPLGQELRSDSPGTAWPSALLASGEIGQAWDALLEAVRTGQPAFDRVFGVDFFTYLESRPELRRTFYASQASDLENTLAGLEELDFAAYRRIVDVGGGDGALLAHVLTTCPNSHGVLLDQAGVAAAAAKRMADAGLSQRCEIVSGNFFSEVPAGGDLYLLRDVLHDWPDDRCVDLLRVCRRAMPDTAVLMVIERISGDGPSASSDGQLIALMDLYMLAVLGGRERTHDEYRNLLRQGGFVPRSVHCLPTGVTLIEGVVA
ncbi:MAG: methyltransferase [Pseudonocardiales bacterium]|nr:methyltransferase [Pseudonocardiales bacterium]